MFVDGKEYYGVIYKIENLVNHKVYIGQTTHPRGFNGRYLYHGSGIERVYNCLNSKRGRDDYHNPYLLRSIEKYGFDAFDVDEVYDVAMSEDELNDKEQYYIAQFDSYNNGYNLTRGGEGIVGCSRNAKRVCQIGLDGQLIKVWDSATAAHNELGVCSASVSRVCANERGKDGRFFKTSGGYVWAFEEDYDPSIDYSRKPQKKDAGKGTKPVLLLSDDGDVVREFYSINDAAAELKDISVEGVRKTCSHRIKNPRYNLVYKSEYMEEQRLSVRGSY